MNEEAALIVLPLVTALNGALSLAAAALADGTAGAQCVALEAIAANLRMALDLHESDVMAGVLDDDDNAEQLEYAHWQAGLWGAP